MSFHFTANARRSETEELLDMVDRGCQYLMRAGGGPLKHEGTNFETLTPNEKRRIANLHAAGHSLEDIAADTGRHYTTIVRQTRQFRVPGRGRKRLSA